MLGFEKAENQIKLPTFVGLEKAGDSSKASTSASLTMKKPLTGWITKILCKVPDHFTCLLRNVYGDQETMVRTEHGTKDWFKIRKRVHQVHQGCILSLCLFNLYAENIMRNARLNESQGRIKIAERNINDLRSADDTPLMAKNEELRTAWWWWKRKSWLKTTF